MSGEFQPDRGIPSWMAHGPQPYTLINPRKLTPIASVAVMMVVWALVYAVAPIHPYAAPTLYPYLLLAISFACLLLGFCLFEPRALPPPAIDRDRLRRMLVSYYRFTYAAGLVGIAFRLMDWIFFRGFSIGLDMAENVEKAKEAGSNPFSTIAIFLIPFTIAPYIFHALARRNSLRVGHPWTAIGLAVLWPLLAMLIGSRSTIFMQVGMIVIARILILPSFRRGAVLSVLALFLVLVHLAGYVFIARIEQIGLNIDAVSRLSVFTQLVPTTQNYYHTMSHIADPWRQIFFIDIMMSQYFLHGVPEFTYLVDHFGRDNTWGAYTFTALIRIYSIVAGTSYDGDAVVALTPRQGIYTTLFGPFYVDFGPLIPLVGLTLGALVSRVRRRVLDGDFAVLPLYVAFMMQMISAVILNTIVSAYGIFYDLAFLGFWAGCMALRRQGLARSAGVAQAA